MSSRYLGLGDGRRSEALKHVQALLNLFGRREMLRAVKHIISEPRQARPQTVRAMRKERRLQRALWAINKMRILGCNATEIAQHVGIDPTAISRLTGSDGSKSVSQFTSDALVDAVQRVGSVRVRKLLADVPIEVLDTCCDKGAIVNTQVRDAIANDVRGVLRNALLLEAVAFAKIRHIRAFVARVGHKWCGLYVVCAPYNPETFDTTEGKIEHLLQVEHELEHLVQRTRAERRRLEGRLPGDGNSSGRIA